MRAGQIIVSMARRLEKMFPGYFDGAKHNHYGDYGWPEHVTFELAYNMYRRNGIARAAVNRTIAKTWEQFPFLLEKPRDGSQGAQVKETALEAEIRIYFDKLRFWQLCAEADRRGMVGHYSGLILRIADNQPFDKPVYITAGGLDMLKEVIPAWEGQLWPVEFDDDTMSDTYGQPTMYQFTESGVAADNRGNQRRQFMVHPDRVVIWSADGKVDGTSDLEPGFNDLLDFEKVKGGGAEGFWKNAKSAPILNVDKDAQLETMAAALGVPMSELKQAMNDRVEDWQKGFDKLLMFQGMEAKTLSITLPQPAEFYNGPLQSFAASMNIPLPILIGMQTSQRSSTEDADEWAQTNMSRRRNLVIPALMEIVNRFVRFGILKESDWTLDWADLTESSMSEKIDRADKMADVNQKMAGTNEIVFTPEEIRSVIDFEPLSDAEKYLDGSHADQSAAMTPPAKPAPPQPQGQ